MLNKEDRARISRENGAKSRGPKTGQGKQKSSINATIHGAYSRKTVLSFESQEAYDQLAESYRRHFQPQNQAESDAVEDMINSRWKIRRFEAIEEGLYKDSDEALKEHEGFSERASETQAADVFLRLLKKDNAAESCAHFLQRYQKAYSRALRNLEKIRKMSGNTTLPKNPNQPNPGTNVPKETSKQQGATILELILAITLIISAAVTVHLRTQEKPKASNLIPRTTIGNFSSYLSQYRKEHLCPTDSSPKEHFQHALKPTLPSSSAACRNNRLCPKVV